MGRGTITVGNWEVVFDSGVHIMDILLHKKIKIELDVPELKKYERDLPPPVILLLIGNVTTFFFNLSHL